MMYCSPDQEDHKKLIFQSVAPILSRWPGTEQVAAPTAQDPEGESLMAALKTPPKTANLSVTKFHVF